MEQKVNWEKENFGIMPLPNLETKFVTANTLIGIEKEGELFHTKAVQEKEQELKTIRHKLFGAKTKETKKKYRQRDEELRNEIAEILKKGNLPVESAEKLASWDPYDQNGVSSFFDPEWMFDIKDGFDVVIGNPPYMRIQGIRENDPAFADWLTDNYKSATGSFDLYANFTEKGIFLCNQNGILNFIMPVKWTNAAFGKGLRGFLIEQQILGKIISFDEHQVFNASTYTGIHFLKKNSTKLQYNQLNADLLSRRELSEYLYELSSNDFNNYNLNVFDEKSWILTDNLTGTILERIHQHAITVDDIFEKIFQGIATSKDSVYFLTACIIKDNLLEGFSKELDKRVSIEVGLTKPLLKGDQVHKYCPITTTNYVIFPYKKINDGKSVLMTETEIQRQFPLTHKYLKSNEIVLRGREKERLKHDDFWFRYIYPKNQTLFDKEKLIAPDVSMGGNFSYDKNGTYYSTTTIYGYIKKRSISESYYYFMSLLNSDLLWWYLQNTGTVLANGYFRFKPDYLKHFPLPKTEKWELLDLLSRALIYLRKEDSINKFNILNRISNALVFELYFPEHMKERKIDILQFVEKDCTESFQLLGVDFQKQDAFDTLSNTQKEQVIAELHKRWSDPNSEIVKRMNSFAEKSPEILKQILES